MKRNYFEKFRLNTETGNNDHKLFNFFNFKTFSFMYAILLCVYIFILKFYYFLLSIFVSAVYFNLRSLKRWYSSLLPCVYLFLIFLKCQACEDKVSFRVLLLMPSPRTLLITGA